MYKYKYQGQKNVSDQNDDKTHLSHLSQRFCIQKILLHSSGEIRSFFKAGNLRFSAVFVVEALTRP